MPNPETLPSRTGLIKQHAPFAAIYLDSNLLLPSWPYEIPAATSQFLHLASLLEIPVYLPVPVEQELEAHWKRERLSRLREYAEVINREMSHLDRSWQTIGRWNELQLIERYRSLCEARKSEKQLLSCSFGEQTVAQFFAAATDQSFPFEKEGKNFQDAVILDSVLTHNVAAGSPPAVFVSRNKRDFAASGVNSANKLRGAHVQYIGGEAEIEQELDKALRSMLVTAWTAIQNVAQRAIEQMRGALEEFLTKQFIKASEVGIELKSIHDVRVFLMTEAESEAAPISFQVDVQFATTIGTAAPLKIDRTIMVTASGVVREGTVSSISLESAALI